MTQRLAAQCSHAEPVLRFRANKERAAGQDGSTIFNGLENLN